MRRFGMMGVLIGALALAACGGAHTGVATPSSTAPPGASTPAAISPTPIVETALVQATQKLIVANEAYQAATVLVGAAIDGGAVDKRLAVTLVDLNRQTGDLLAKGSRATLAVDRLYFAEQALDLTDAIKRILSNGR